MQKECHKLIGKIQTKNLENCLALCRKVKWPQQKDGFTIDEIMKCEEKKKRCDYF